MFMLFMCVLWCASALAESAQYYALEDAELYFENFISKYNKHYADEHEKAARFEIFKAKLEDINRSNAESNHAVFGITRFADLTSEEFIQMYTGRRSSTAHESFYCGTLVTDADIPDAGAPEALDWRSANIVTPIKDQGTICGSCYAFSTTGHLEGQYAIKHGQLVSLSEQQIIDCDEKSSGCFGGFAAFSMRELIRLGGSVPEQGYPYEGEQGKCRSNSSQAVVKLSACYSYNLTSQDKVKQLLYKTGPISISVKPKALQTYTNGILSDVKCSVGDIGHAVLLVGYGTENDKPYWIVKNSYNVTFGEQGYFRMERSNNSQGACGMLNDHMTTADIE